MIFMFRKREAKIKSREKDITNAKQVLHRKINRDLKEQNELISILKNGITLEIKQAIGGKHG